MSKEYTALGLMSGTSGDGVDASIIQSDGQNKCKLISDKYFEYDRDIYKNIHGLKENVVSSKVPKKILKKVTSKKIQIILLKNSDHRLSRKKDLQALVSAIDMVRYD